MTNIDWADSPRRISKNRKVSGVGINDADYAVVRKHGKERLTCPFYAVWRDMIKRCSSQVFVQKNKSYEDCTVCEEWKRFSNFKSWMEQQDWICRHLDKDIIKPGNKHYSPETCCFVEPYINGLVTYKQDTQSTLPIGVSLYKRTGKYRASCKHRTKKLHLGYFDTPEKAHEAYVRKKIDLLASAADYQLDDRVINGLHLHAEALAKSAGIRFSQAHP